jgi:hypothetical protein
MTNKPVKSAADSKNADRRPDVDNSVDESATKKKLGPVREGPDNLRQRADWFRSRSGEK